jgi:hypothetical protein
MTQDIKSQIEKDIENRGIVIADLLKQALKEKYTLQDFEDAIRKDVWIQRDMGKLEGIKIGKQENQTGNINRTKSFKKA